MTTRRRLINLILNGSWWKIGVVCYGVVSLLSNEWDAGMVGQWNADVVLDNDDDDNDDGTRGQNGEVIWNAKPPLSLFLPMWTGQLLYQAGAPGPMEFAGCCLVALAAVALRFECGALAAVVAFAAWIQLSRCKDGSIAGREGGYDSEEEADESHLE
jgi:hypothetical protein